MNIDNNIKKNNSNKKIKKKLFESNEDYIIKSILNKNKIKDCYEYIFYLNKIYIR